MNEKEFKIEKILPEETLVLRQELLRQHQKVEELVFPGDDDKDTIHFGIFYQNELAGIASLYNKPMKGEVNDYSWQLRGMATKEKVRGFGFGRELMNECISHVKSRNGKLFWCNARTTAEKFYEKFGMKRTGDVFTPEGLGEHVVMTLLLDS